MPPADLIERLAVICAEVGFDLAGVEASVLARLRRLADGSHTLTDVERMAATAVAVFRVYDETKPAQAFGELEKRTVVLGCLFSDIGKTGPRDADAEAQDLIVDMFSIERVPNEQMPVSEFLGRYFPEDAEARTARFVSLGLDPAMTIRQFWNLHSEWTLDIVDATGVPPEAVAAAASHHFVDGINPDDIVGDDHRFTRAFGGNDAFDRAEKLIVVLDKYDAARRRGLWTHDEAIAWLRARIDANPRFRGDPELEQLILDVDQVARPSDAN